MSLFLSYDWKEDTLDRVASINYELMEGGIGTCFEEHRVAGDIMESLTNHIDECDMVICFLTMSYIDQLLTDDSNRLSWCSHEWNYAHRSLGSAGILLVLLEPELLEEGSPYADFIEANKLESQVLDFTGDADVSEIVHCYEEHKAYLENGHVRRRRAKQSFVEAPVDWDAIDRTLYYPNGDIKYIGTVLFGKMHGRGTYYFRNGDRYEGMFENDYFAGAGIYYSANGARFEGHYRYDQRHGMGKSFRADGTLKYEGEYSCGLRCGNGTEYNDEGQPWRDVQYEDGELVNVIGFHGDEPAEDAPVQPQSQEDLPGRGSISEASTSSSGSNPSSRKSWRKSLGQRLSIKRVVRAGRFTVQE